MNCGNSIPWRPGRKARERAKYCSQECHDKHPDYLPGKMCLECGGPLRWREGRAERESAKFCGNPCKLAWQKRNPTKPRAPRTTVPCETCGEPVSYLPSQRGMNRAGRSAAIYCSRKCKGVGHSKVMTGRRPRNGVYASPETFRVMIRREFHDRCALCGWTEAPCDVCHIVARKNGGTDTLGNVVMLCPNHHRLFDMGRIPVEQVRIARDTILR